jgi:hypothetical protein
MDQAQWIHSATSGCMAWCVHINCRKAALSRHMEAGADIEERDDAYAIGGREKE